jgi:thiamine kinase-like enzyme
MLTNDTQTIYTAAESDIFVHNDTEERNFLMDDRTTTVVDTELCHAQDFCISPVSSYHSEQLRQ